MNRIDNYLPMLSHVSSLCLSPRRAKFSSIPFSLVLIVHLLHSLGAPAILAPLLTLAELCIVSIMSCPNFECSNHVVTNVDHGI